MSIINLILTVSYRTNLESHSMPKSSRFWPENSEEHILVERYNHTEKEKFRDTFISKCTTNFVFRNKEVIKLLKIIIISIIIIIIIIIIIWMDVSMYVFMYSQIVGKFQNIQLACFLLLQSQITYTFRLLGRLDITPSTESLFNSFIDIWQLRKKQILICL